LSNRSNSNVIETFDSGLRGGRENHAIDRLWLSGHVEGKRAASLRFHRSTPTASLGLHQAADRELRLDYCRAKGIAVTRRVSGGGAIYLDPSQLGFSLIFRRPDALRGAKLETLLRLFCEGVREGLRRMGIVASFKYPNDLEVEDRKVGSAFVASAGEALLLNGILLLGADVKTMLEALRVPTEKLSADGLAAARDRLTTINDCLGTDPRLDEVEDALTAGLADALGLSFQDERDETADLCLAPEMLLQEDGRVGQINWADHATNWIEAVSKTTCATLRVRAEFESGGRRFRHVAFAGDMVVSPPGLFRMLEGALAGLPVGLADQCVADVLRRSPVDTVGVEPRDIQLALRLVTDKQSARESMGLSADQVNAVMVYSPEERDEIKRILERATVMLVPYCAKPAWCKWRHLDGCAECGLCEVGTAYRLARERGMRVTTITNYEHLVSTLAEMKADVTPAYVGMCCGEFFIKRHRAFRDAGMPAVLMDISGATCYELKQEDHAYAGRFRAEAKLDEELVGKVMRFVPPARASNEPPKEMYQSERRSKRHSLRINASRGDRRG
jgi:lipoate-protein ligase A